MALAFSSDGTATCRPCHAAIVDAYLKTGMGRSVERRAVPDGTFYHRLSNRHYRLRGATLRRHQVDGEGKEVNIVEKSIDLIIGSGNHAETLVHRTPQGRLLEMPISRYRTYYAMSPGYDRPDHPDFRREINENCLFCHSASIDPAPIDCGRCHGDASAHRNKPGRGNILNPARLSTQRQLEICLQCHLETASRGIPDSLRKPGRAVFSYRPGEPLGNYKAYFDRAGDPAPRFEVNHAGYRLLNSECFRKSEATMTCVTCHDPHTARARNACAGCHASAHARQTGDCAGCHMPKRRTEDAIHVTMTDHWIQRQPSYSEPRFEDHRPYTGDIVPFFWAGGSEMLKLANALLSADRQRTSEAFRALPPTPQNLASLGEALAREGKRAQAKRVLSQVLKADRTSPVALNAMAVMHATEGQLDQALRLLHLSRQANPDHPLTWVNLGVTWEAKGDPGRASEAYREAIRHQPDFAEARHRLSALLARTAPR
ncbi:MAG: hypothetical protein HY235_27870 [Acidobacteria bacterium]|nr:hypothetical protein [Acidobacteriota bacterium]